MKNIFFVICLSLFLIGEAGAEYYAAKRVDNLFILNNSLTIITGEITKTFPFKTGYGVLSTPINDKVIIFNEEGNFCNTHYIVSNEKYNIIKKYLKNSLQPVRSFDPLCSYTKQQFIN